jgi:Tfp pilus assembly protein PilV
MKNKFIKNILGITILEGLVSTAIVGIGFVAILQMVNYSVQSIDVSGERTKANYLVSMIAEDIIGHRDSTYKKFADHLTEGEGEGWEAPDACKREVAGGTDTATNVANIYEGEGNAPENMEAKWDNIISKDRYLKCRGEKDIKKVKVFKVCSWGCTYSIAGASKDEDSAGYIINYYDEAMYIGRVQINLNNGKKRKFLYFQADYKLKKRETLIDEEEEGESDEGPDLPSS